MNRSVRKRLGEETVAILKAGVYTSGATQKSVLIADALRAAVDGTYVLPSDTPLPLPSRGCGGGGILRCTDLTVTTESSLAASRRLFDRYSEADRPARVVCLNFASAHNPGGGFLGGSQAQEESLARCSGLYACQTAHPGMYQHNGRRKFNLSDPHTLYSDHMLYSPDVPVFRDEVTGRLEEGGPWSLSFITAPAPNAGAVHNTYKGKVDAATLDRLIDETMRRRLLRVLSLAHKEGHRCLVLGAYGCGVFKNPPERVAAIFAELLRHGGPFEDVFDTVVFAVYAKNTEDRTFAAFHKLLHSPSQDTENTRK